MFGFLTETERVYYAVRNVSLHIIQAYINLRDLFWSKRHCDRFSSEHFSFSLSLSSHKRPVLIFIYISLLPEGQTVKIGKSYRKQCRCGYTGAVDRKILSLSSSLKCWSGGWHFDAMTCSVDDHDRSRILLFEGITSWIRRLWGTRKFSACLQQPATRCL